METPDGSPDGTAAVTVATATVSASGFASADPDATLSLGSGQTGKTADWPTIDGYEIVEQLGEGGGGRVFKAEQLKAGRRVVAIKVLHGVSKLERERLAREVRSLGKISHPNIVTIYEVGESSEGPYFTMEFMAGGSLAERIRAKALEPMESARIVEGVACGVAAAHARGILHRDLKPSNVLLAADGTAKVSDFGLARLADTAGDATTLERITPTGAVLGTPAYMAPEQAAGRTKEIDERTDVYGIGAVLYHCLTGKAPFKGETQVEIAQRVAGEEVVPPRRFRKEIPRDLEAVCLKCVEKVRGRRYAAAQEVVSELDRVGRGQATLVRPVGNVGRVVRLLRRNSRTLLAIAAAFALVAVAVIGTRRYLKTETPDPDIPLRAHLAALAAGSEVALVPDEGPPAWTAWPDGQAPFRPSVYRDGVCSFEATARTRMELLPHLPPGRYVVNAEIRQDQQPSGSRGFAGLYFARTRTEIPGRGSLSWGYEIEFSEVPESPHSAPSTTRCQAIVHSKADIQTPNRADLVPDGIYSRIYFDPIPLESGQQRPWRQIRVEMSSSGFTASWHTGEEWKQFGRIPADQKWLESNRRGTQKMIDKVLGASGASVDLPQWSESGALGIFAHGCAVSVRNVRITPY